ncbi:response regulator transcription factor [Streptomyces sp. NBC_00203]|uniref:helix-turn-helix transcriptional regulator n=1 Tax=Streptomyces sp. NBC_00203 TaxID=2975680 RepID=UPI003246268B
MRRWESHRDIADYGDIADHGDAADHSDQWTRQLVKTCDPATACEVLYQALAELPRHQGGVQLTGRFAVEMVSRPASELSRLVRNEILRRGHGLRLLLGQAAASEPVARTVMGHVAAEGAHVRVSSGPLPNLAFVGTELAVVYAFARDGQPLGLVVRGEAMSALHQYQQVLWDHGTEPVPHCHTARSVVLDPAQAQVLRLLGSGMKDDTAARQMNVSVRTYRRHVAAILKSLHVNTRFEAGLKAAELGLLSKRRTSAQDTGLGGGRLMPSFLSGNAC